MGSNLVSSAIFIVTLGFTSWSQYGCPSSSLQHHIYFYVRVETAVHKRKVMG